MVLGDTILNNIYPYTSEGGNPVLKIHPGTWVIIASLLILGGAIGYGKLLSNFAINNKSIFIATICTCITMLYTVIMWGIGGAAYFIDTYLYSLIALILAAHLNKKHTTQLFKAIIYIITLNSSIAIYEYTTRSHLVPNPLTGTYWFFRANALMAHPLNNALITISVALVALISPISRFWRWNIFILCLLALLAFATRASLAVYILATFLILWTYAFTGKLSKKNRLLYVVILPFLVVLLVIGFYLAIFHTHIGFGIASRLTFDASAMARLDAVDFLLRVDAGSYLLGAGSEGFSQLVARLSSVSIIENFWIQLIVTLGLPVFGVLIYGFFSLTKWLAEGSSLQYKIVILTFLLAASTNNSLSVKTAALAVFLLSLYLTKKMHEFQTVSAR
ncbi:hypothetical protein E5198_00270 [Pseudomonas sp. A-1]|nr:hypothetical protein E5198_00270 [Pseudomonas sp. A-1]